MPLSIGRRFAILVGGMGNTSKSPLSHPSRKHEGCESLSIGCFPLPFGGCRGRKRVGKCRKTGFPPPFQPKKRGKRRGNSSKCLFSHPSSKSGGCEPVCFSGFPIPPPKAEDVNLPECGGFPSSGSGKGKWMRKCSVDASAAGVF